MKIIFGLGNPGQKYSENRHNLGNMIVDEFVKIHRLKYKVSFRLNVLIAKLFFGNEEILLVKPGTYMNNSGSCVARVLAKYKVDPKDSLVIYDEVDLDLGDIRFRQKGSCAGHRGMVSIVNSIGTEYINRLRVGVGKNNSGELADYVLSNFSRDEKKILVEVIDKSVFACREWIEQGIEYVMANYNRRGGNGE
ncbi:MAG: aminoacyl-tRNA hydrolase [Candidatus Omnitrophica bacterium]|nr:aminoacyl-tRNA hydrolase [Candidatus Omnitrophota bacterium]MCK5287857.1 aminoacyl-tRNA hydrolase [Candidatus Omnitrophota bacterium]